LFMGAMASPALAQLQKKHTPPPAPAAAPPAAPSPAKAQETGKPNIIVIWGDDIGQSNISAYTNGLMGYRTPNIDSIAQGGMLFTDYYGEQSCTAGRSAFITGQSVFRTGLSKVGLPGADLGLRKEDPTIAELLKAQGYATGQFGKNHLGDKDEFLPTAHGFDEFYGNLYHLNAEEEPELRAEFSRFMRISTPRVRANSSNTLVGSRSASWLPSRYIRTFTSRLAARVSASMIGQSVST
jgi:arylsulfatase A-like enzyme